MNKKKSNDLRGIVFSTDPDFKFEEADDHTTTLPPSEQKLRVRLDTKQRGGKAVTLTEGFIGKEEDLQELGRKLKTFCGSGGSAKDHQVIVQGDQREKVLGWLLKNGYSKSKRI